MPHEIIASHYHSAYNDYKPQNHHLIRDHPGSSKANLTIMSIMHAWFEAKNDIPCGSMWLTKCAAHAICIVRAPSIILRMIFIKIRTKLSPSVHLRLRYKAVLQKPIWFFLSLLNSGRLGPVPSRLLDFLMFFRRKLLAWANSAFPLLRPPSLIIRDQYH